MPIFNPHRPMDEVFAALEKLDLNTLKKLVDAKKKSLTDHVLACEQCSKKILTLPPDQAVHMKNFLGFSGSARLPIVKKPNA